MILLKKFLKYSLIIILVAISVSILLLKIIPTKSISFLTGKIAAVDRLVCGVSVKVIGESMNPLIVPGSSVEVDRCFKGEDLKEGVAVLFNDGQNQRFGIIRHILPLQPVVYKVSDEKAPQLFHDLIEEEIIGVAENVDTSRTKYKNEAEADSFVIDSDEYLSDIFLGKIPRGYGEEMAEIEKTTVFSRNTDKFCSVVVPKKDLFNVDIEIIGAETGKTIVLANDVIFNVRSKPNSNCMDFGSGEGMLNLGAGIYRYRFLVNHQALADIRFEVR